MTRKNIDMLNGPLFKNIVRYTIPIMLTGLLQLLFNATDMVVVGRFCGSISVGAVSSTGALTNLIVNLFIGLSIGTGVTVAHGIGSNRTDFVRKAVHTALPTAIIGGILVSIVGVVFSKTFLIWMGTPENVLPLSAVYMKIYFSGMTFTIVYNFCSSILRAAGDTKSPLLYLSISGITNVVLNVVFVTIFHMNVAGVALATIISQGISAVLVVRALCKRTDACKLVLKKIRIYKEPLLKFIRIGLPAGIQSSLFSISNVLIQSSINSFNSDALVAGNGAAANLDGFIYIALNSFYQTTVNFVGQNMGARQYGRIKKIFLTSVICVVVLGVLIGLGMYAAGKTLLGIYITDSPEAIAYGMIRLAYVGIPYFLCGLMEVSTGALRGMGCSVTSMIISILGVCGVRIMWILTVFPMPQFHSLEYLYISYTISWIFTFTAQTIAYNVMFKRQQLAYPR